MWPRPRTYHTFLLQSSSWSSSTWRSVRVGSTLWRACCTWRPASRTSASNQTSRSSPPASNSSPSRRRTLWPGAVWTCWGRRPTCGTVCSSSSSQRIRSSSPGRDPTTFSSVSSPFRVCHVRTDTYGIFPKPFAQCCGPDDKRSPDP